MVIVTRKHIATAAVEFQDAAKELAAWEAIVSQVRRRNFADVRATFPDADTVDGYVIFNIRHNRYRLVTVLHFARQLGVRTTQGHCYIRSCLTHAAYNNKANWDKEFGR